MPSRLSPIRTDKPVPTGLMILAGILCLFVPVVILIPFSLVLESPLGAEPLSVELFVYMGWMFGLAALPFALALAHFANRKGINGWLPAIAGGAGFGAFAAILMGGNEPEFLRLSIALGTTYAATFWALAHGMARIGERGARR